MVYVGGRWDTGTSVNSHLVINVARDYKPERFTVKIMVGRLSLIGGAQNLKLS